jgi:tetratricopeptide (TPR) repeat protein
VDTLLTGSFFAIGDDLRITYQLIDVKTNKIVGRGTIDLTYDKLLRVEDKVAQRIIQELQLNLSPSEAQSIKPDAPINPLAYECYLRGVDLQGRHNFSLAIKMLHRSTEIEPNYAPAWAYFERLIPPMLPSSLVAANTTAARKLLRNARLPFSRRNWTPISCLANLLVDTAKVEQAVPWLRDALKTTPNHRAVHWELGYAYRFAGMLNESAMECELAPARSRGQSQRLSLKHLPLSRSTTSCCVACLISTIQLSFFSIAVSESIT